MSEYAGQSSHILSNAAPYEQLFSSLFASSVATSKEQGMGAGDSMACRRKSLNDLLASGVPSRKSEAYKYFSLRSLFFSDPLAGGAALHWLGGGRPGQGKEVREPLAGFAQVFWQEAEDLPLPAELTLVNGSRISGGAQAAGAVDHPGSKNTDNIEVVETLARAQGQDPDAEFDPFTAAIFAIFSENTLVVKVGAKSENNHAPRKMRLSLRHILALAQAQSFLVSHVVVQLAAGWELDLIWDASAEQLSISAEGRAGAHQIFERLSFELAPGAQMSACLDLSAIPDAFRFVQLEARLAKGARLDLLSQVSGAGRVRVNTLIELLAADATVNLWGMAQTHGRAVVDHHTEIRHRATNTRSTQSYKAISGEASRCIFDGSIVVSPGVSQIDARQRIRGMLLSDEAEIDVKPELRIEADDVKCSHGASIGGMDPEQLFYLRSRGLNLSESVRLLTQGFIADLVDGDSSPMLARLWQERILYVPESKDSASQSLDGPRASYEKEL